MRYYDLIETPLTGKTFLEQNESNTRIPATNEKVSAYFRKVDLVKYDRGFDEYCYPILLEHALQEDGTRYQFYLEAPDLDGVYQPDLGKIQEVVEAGERAWRNSELLWYDGYQKKSLWEMLCCVDQEALYRYYISLLDYPQSEGFPYGTRPSRPPLLIDGECTAEMRWEKSVQRELNARRLTPLTIVNALAGDSGAEVSVTILISPTESTISTITAYVAESVVNGLVDIWWDTDGGEMVKLTVQNLKPVFKSIEKYLRDMYETRKNLIARFGESGLVLTDDSNWPSRTITLS